MLRVAANVAYDQVRRAARERRAVDERPRSPDPTEIVDLRVTLVPALRRLSTRQREVVVLTHLAGLQRGEIADLLGCSEESVKTHLRRGLHRLRTDLDTDDGEGDGRP